VKQLRDQQNAAGIPAISEGLSIACVTSAHPHFVLMSMSHSRVTEQPYKIPYYAAVLRLLHEPQDDGVAMAGPSLGRQLLEDLWKRFHVNVDKRAWRETRLYVSENVNRPRYVSYSIRTPIGTSVRALSHGEDHITRLHGCPSTIIYHCLRGVRSIAWSGQKGRDLCW
jgi:hypothetical protein